MHIGPVVQILEGPRPDIVFFLVTVWFHGLQNGRLQFLAHQLKQSTVRFPVLLLKLCGCVSFYRIFTCQFGRRQSFIVITSLPFTCPTGQAHRDRHSFCSRKGGFGASSSSSCSLFSSVCGHLHQGLTDYTIYWYLIQSQHCSTPRWHCRGC
jgi:hypothetical protein